MARVPYVSPEDLDEPDRPLLNLSNAMVLTPQVSATQVVEGETAPNIYRAIANSPDGLRHWSVAGRWFQRGSQLSPRLRELALLQVAYATRTAYQWSHHIKIGRRVGLTDQDIVGLIAASEGQPHSLEELDALVLQAAREITSEARAMSDPTWDRLLERMGRARLVDLTLLIAHANAVVRVLMTLRVDVEAEFEPYLNEFPLPPA